MCNNRDRSGSTIKVYVSITKQRTDNNPEYYMFSSGPFGTAMKSYWMSPNVFMEVLLS